MDRRAGVTRVVDSTRCFNIAFVVEVLASARRTRTWIGSREQPGDASNDIIEHRPAGVSYNK